MSNDKKAVTIILRGVPDDVHKLIVEERARLELSTGKQASNPQAMYGLIRKAKKANEKI
jgi:hypothetical protein